jgi:hypothetical protein
VTDLEHARPKGKASEVESEGGVINHSAGAVRVRSEGPSWIQIEHGFGKSAVLLLWVSSFVSALAVVGLAVAIISWQRMSAHVAVLEYDHQSLKSKLVAQGLIEGDGH